MCMCMCAHTHARVQRNIKISFQSTAACPKAPSERGRETKNMTCPEGDEFAQFFIHRKAEPVQSGGCVATKQVL